MTQRDLRKYLFDIVDRCGALKSYAAGRTFADYEGDRMLRSAVERELEIVGEALRQALRVDPSLETRISETRRIIAFRNWLAHAYSEVDSQIVWDILQRNLPQLEQEARVLLEGSQDGGDGRP